MNKFKVGDKVKCVDAMHFNDIKNGKKYKILGVAKDNCVAVFTTTPCFYYPECFELIQEPKYKVVKPFSLLDIYKLNPCRDEFEKLLEERSNKSVLWQFNIWDDIKNSNILMHNLPWLEETGFIEKYEMFEPFTLELKIESEDQLLEVRQRFNVPWSYIKDGGGMFPMPKNSNSMPFFNQIDLEMHRIKSK